MFPATLQSSANDVGPFSAASFFFVYQSLTEKSKWRSHVNLVSTTEQLIGFTTALCVAELLHRVALPLVRVCPLVSQRVAEPLRL